MRLRMYWRYATRSLLRGGQHTLFAIFCVAVGVMVIVAHQVIVNCLRYLLERMSEEQILEIDRGADVPNCSVTSYAFDPAAGRAGKLVPQLVNFVAPLEEAGAPVTAAPDTPGAATS